MPVLNHEQRTIVRDYVLKVVENSENVLIGKQGTVFVFAVRPGEDFFDWYFYGHEEDLLRQAQEHDEERL